MRGGASAGRSVGAPEPPLLLVGNFLSSSRRYRLACEDLARQLANRGWSLWTTSEKPGRLMRLLDMMSSSWRLRNRYGAAQVDVFSGSAFLWAEAACWTLRRARKRYVLTLRGGDLPLFAARWPRRVRRLLNSAFAVTAPSRYLLERMAPYRGGNLLLIPNALDVGAYSFRLRERAEPSLVWLRAFHQIYNAPLAVQVVAGLVAEFPEIRLTMVGPDRGDGSLDETRETTERLRLAHNVQFPGAVPKSAVPGRLNQGDVFLNTSNVDNTPTSVLEAMACGLCVVSTNVGGIPYLLEDGEDALLVAPNDARAMAAAVRRLLTEPGLAARLSRNGRAKVQRMDWSAILPQWEALFVSAARGSEA